jgi:hypothetical protein
MDELIEASLGPAYLLGKGGLGGSGRPEKFIEQHLSWVERIFRLTHDSDPQW